MLLLAVARRAPLAELAAEPPLPDQGVDPAEYLDILRDAVEARNGWQRILARGAPPGPAPHRAPKG